MILPTMTPIEKHNQIKYVAEYVYKNFLNKMNYIDKKLSKGKVFPYFYTEDAEIPNMGKWILMYSVDTRFNQRKGIITLNAYQKFYVSHAKDSLNIGTGIYMFSGRDDGIITCEEYSPHYFNRLRERWVEPKGIVQPKFDQLVKSMKKMDHSAMSVVAKGLLITKESDGTYSLTRSTTFDKKEGYNNFIMYSKDGVSYGLIVGNYMYVHFSTFISNNLLREGQKKWQKKFLAEMRQYEYSLKANPFKVLHNYNYVPLEEDI